MKLTLHDFTDLHIKFGRLRRSRTEHNIRFISTLIFLFVGS